MNRRDFIYYGGAGWLALQKPLFAAGMDGMAGMQPMQHGAPASSLMPHSALPSGAPLQSLTRLKNQSRKPGTFSATLRAAPGMAQFKHGVRTPVWAYNGSVPGPLIEVFEGDTLNIKLINQLPQPTTIHWHGLPVPADQDGNPGSEIPAGKSHSYRFTLPEGCAGTYWFHPHPHGHTSEQVFRGLAGVIIVRSKNDPLAHLPEQHLVFSDLKLQANGKIAPNDMNDWMNGREGQFVLVNGQLQPRLNVTGRQRWRLWNACSARFLRLKLPGQAFVQVGTDGGLLQAPVQINELLLAPGERAEVVVSGNGNAALVAAAYDRGKMGDAAAEQDLVLLHAQFKIAGVPTALPQQLRTIEPLGTPVIRREFVFSEDMGDMDAAGNDASRQKMAFLINGKTFDMQRVDFTSKLNEVEAWALRNDADMDHPFHVHGTPFQVVQRELKGVTTTEKLLAWRDVVNVRPGETVTLHIAQRLPGRRVYHCHILEHEDLGMMGQMDVI